MSRHEIYNSVVALTSEIRKTGIAEKLFYAANAGYLTWTENLYKSFICNYPDLYQKIVDFGKRFDQIAEEDWRECVIFDEHHPFNPSKINPLDLYILVIYGFFGDGYLFRYPCDMDPWLNAIHKAGYSELAYFIANNDLVDYIGDGEDGDEEEAFKNPCELLIAIFAGEFDE